MAVRNATSRPGAVGPVRLDSGASNVSTHVTHTVLVMTVVEVMDTVTPARMRDGARSAMPPVLANTVKAAILVTATVICANSGSGVKPVRTNVQPGAAVSVQLWMEPVVDVQQAIGESSVRMTAGSIVWGNVINTAVGATTAVMATLGSAVAWNVCLEIAWNVTERTGSVLGVRMGSGETTAADNVHQTVNVVIPPPVCVWRNA